MDVIELVPEEFFAEENLNYNKEVLDNEGVLEDSLPKWHRQALHPRPLGERAQAIAARSRSLAAGSALCALAIRPAQCRTPPQ
jgi:hypothetical protein